jgi:hypothetical protein
MNGLLLLFAASGAALTPAPPAPTGTAPRVQAVGRVSVRVLPGVRITQAMAVPQGARRRAGLIEFE